jgi:7-cyano-7-deazaguanine synthase
MSEKYDLLVLFSGGADSVLMLEFAKELNKRPFCVIIDYEQLHSQELVQAYEYLRKEHVEWRKVRIKGLEINSGLTGSGEKNESGEVHEMYVPGRNTMFLSIAFSIAESMGIDTIWHGADFSDRLNLFPDCYQEYFVAFNDMLQWAGPKDIKVEAPLIGLTKENILYMLSQKGIMMEDIFSGYGDL